ncbi:N-acetylmuramoyl-L-alanine amidase family protein [Paenisporosarcina antarctica]|uniref:N-acetylmuramoyl-L-alanine amidase n=1 Tax=Paenisporosarcina antarctica TaxID=417367 RepID=A0A4P7A1Z4_9BACL|nr:N-acetylmuramoyl-L-alanine amidase [Paenisporosarcina antarctica]QBP41946.1 N-acetylmuramoyl-L-alanine amidase [Paenisporosarcina antarctica]
MKKVAWSAGHGINTAGKRSPTGEREWSFNNKVVIAGMAFLAKYDGVQQLRVDDSSGKTDIPLVNRTNQANAWKADIYVSSHHNAIGNEWGNHSGVETFVMEPASNNPLSFKLANEIHPKVVHAMQILDRGVKSANFHELRETNMPSVLVEGGFMDSRTDSIKMRDDKFLKAQGEAIAKGIVDYFELKIKPIKPDPIEEEVTMLERAIVIGSLIDYPAAEILSIRLKAPIYPRHAITGKVAVELIVVGGSVNGLIADKLTNLSGSNRFETAANVAKYKI